MFDVTRLLCWHGITTIEFWDWILIYTFDQVFGICIDFSTFIFFWSLEEAIILVLFAFIAIKKDYTWLLQSTGTRSTTLNSGKGVSTFGCEGIWWSCRVQIWIPWLVVAYCISLQGALFVLTRYRCCILWPVRWPLVRPLLNSRAIQCFILRFVEHRCFRRRWFGSIDDVLATWYMSIGHVLSVTTLAVWTLNSSIRLCRHSFRHLNGNLVCPGVSCFLCNLHLPSYFNGLLNGVWLFSPACLVSNRFLCLLRWALITLATHIYLSLGSLSALAFMVKYLSSWDYCLTITALIGINFILFGFKRLSELYFFIITVASK